MSRAKTLVLPGFEQALTELAPVSGFNLRESSKRSARRGSSSRTSRAASGLGCPRCGETCTCLVTIRPPSRFLPSTSGRLTFDAESSSLLPTLTATANMLCPSMQKWPGHQRLLPTLTRRDDKGPGPKHTKGGRDLPQEIGGHLSANWCRWFMGFPVGWLDVDDENESGPSATPSCPSVPRSSDE